ncbi:HEPN domain-containing protein [Tepidibacter hydrothermalis]|uniref:HEPN domain-containing protein n=1 Tax=Tepidibacter hydrothermalis TaxID=3036126 RepID=A0ABY8E9Z5_9FIRM|nr:HEPN domain-containing protein [Tepidibacter hydrothermalis]WFD08755.1 HEPN domain-containing protein [Tepidibacter hydrothermalis]
MDIIKSLYKKMFYDFKKYHLESLKNRIYQNSNRVYKEISIPIEISGGRYSSHNIKSKGNCYIDLKLLQNLIVFEIYNFQNKSLLENLFEKLIESEVYCFSDKDFEYSFNNRKQPSIIYNLIASFFLRALEIEQFTYKMDDKYFEIVFNELKIILENQNIEYSIFVNLYGVEGTLEEFNVGDIYIKKATKKIADMFCYHYNSEMDLCDEMYEGEYYIEIKRTIDKNNWMNEFNQEEKKSINKAFELIAMSGDGNIEKGKILRVSNDWSIIRTSRIMHFYRDMNSVGNRNNYMFKLDGNVKKNIEENYEYFYGKHSNIKNENCINTAKKRLMKAKVENNINDRVVELALALEYSIITERGGISKALREKSAVLYHYNNLTEFRNTKDVIFRFYDMRGKVVHGKEEIIINDENIRLINKAENIIRSNILLLIKLNKYHSIQEIDSKIKALSSNRPKKSLSKIL